MVGTARPANRAVVARKQSAPIAPEPNSCRDAPAQKVLSPAPGQYEHPHLPVGADGVQMLLDGDQLL